jgi:ribosomal protein L22
MSKDLKVVATSVLKSVAIGPKKLVMPSKYVRGKTVSFVLNDCSFQNSKAFRLILMVVKSARSNLAVQLKKDGMEVDDTKYIVDIHTNRGSGSMRRYLPKAKGSFGLMTKEKSNISVRLMEVING